MTLSDTIRIIETVARLQPSVHTVVPNDIFALNAMPDAEFAVFGWTQGQHTISPESSLANYSFTFFYIDRLTADQSNRMEIQSVGIQVLDNIIRILEDAGAQIGTHTYTTFSQRFVDECAGVYASVTLSVPLDGICGEGYYDFSNDFNDDFSTTGKDISLDGLSFYGDGIPGEGIVWPGGHGGCNCPPNILKYYLCADQAEYESIEPKDPGTLYLIPEQ